MTLQILSIFWEDRFIKGLELNNTYIVNFYVGGKQDGFS